MFNNYDYMNKKVCETFIRKNLISKTRIED